MSRVQRLERQLVDAVESPPVASQTGSSVLAASSAPAVHPPPNAEKTSTEDVSTSYVYIKYHYSYSGNCRLGICQLNLRRRKN